MDREVIKVPHRWQHIGQQYACDVINIACIAHLLTATCILQRYHIIIDYAWIMVFSKHFVNASLIKIHPKIVDFACRKASANQNSASAYY